MPGRTPRDAVEEVLAPLRDAVRALDGVGKLLVSPKGGYRKGVRYSWVLNGADGMDLGATGRAIASVEFEVIKADPAKNEYGHPLRVTARSYPARALVVESVACPANCKVRAECLTASGPAGGALVAERRPDRPVPPMAGTAAIGAVVRLLPSPSRKAGTCPPRAAT